MPLLNRKAAEVWCEHARSLTRVKAGTHTRTTAMSTIVSVLTGINSTILSRRGAGPSWNSSIFTTKRQETVARWRSNRAI